MKKLSIIDGNNILREVFEGIIVRKGFEEAHNIHFKMNIEEKHFNRMFLDKLRAASKATGADFIFLTFDSNVKCWRYDVLPEYKANRKKDALKKELWEQILLKFQKYLKSRKIPFTVVDGLEADDVIATVALKHSDNYDITIVSADKDMHQLIQNNVSVYNFRQKKMYSIDTIEENTLIKKVLGGDKSDNISGIKSMSEEKIKEIEKLFPKNLTPELSELEKFVSIEEVPQLKLNYKLITLNEYDKVPFRKFNTEVLKFLK